MSVEWSPPTVVVVSLTPLSESLGWCLSRRSLRRIWQRTVMRWRLWTSVVHNRRMCLFCAVLCIARLVCSLHFLMQRKLPTNQSPNCHTQTIEQLEKDCSFMSKRTILGGKRNRNVYQPRMQPSPMTVAFTPLTCIREFHRHEQPQVAMTSIWATRSMRPARSPVVWAGLSG